MATVKTPEQIQRDKDRNAAIRAAKETVRGFFGNKLFGKLPEEIQTALKALAPQARQATNTLALELKGLFADKQSLTELDVFKALKVGPNEMKAKVNHCLKVAAPEDRMWISYDAGECVWTLEAEGATMPEGFNPDNLIPSIVLHSTNPEFAEKTVVQLIADAKAATEPVEAPE